MIKTNELRRGNWLMGSQPVQVDQILSETEVGLKEGGNPYSVYVEKPLEPCLNPILLTPEILEKAGFEKADTKQNDNIEFTFYSSKAIDKDVFSIRIDLMKELQRVLILPVFKNIALPMHLNTVDQLQNLCFYLTGQELEITF